MSFPWKAMNYTVLLLLVGGLGTAGAAEFASPVRLKAEGELIKVESPGYAAPCLADMDGDGKKDLLVGAVQEWSHPHLSR